MHGNFSEWVDFAWGLSGIGKGLQLRGLPCQAFGYLMVAAKIWIPNYIVICTVEQSYRVLYTALCHSYRWILLDLLIQYNFPPRGIFQIHSLYEVF